METIEVTRTSDGAGEGADGAVVTITLNRPEKKNAIKGVMWDDLLATFREIAQGDDRVVVLTGAGGAFCSGADLSGGGADTGSRPQHPLAAMRHVGDVALALHRLPQPTIAKVGGVAAGAGANMAFSCDLIVAADDARFTEIFARRGLTIDFGGSWVLPRLVGLHKAKELAFFADIISAKEAEALGVVNRVVPAGALEASVADGARGREQGPAIGRAQRKRLLHNAMAVTMEQALEGEGTAQTVNFGTADTAEAMAAFLAKREPHFEGR
jgi:2-(1,2-epoxy-1,2-dihydrophenyl)acetyl-CoA isomerase